jgi:hypothetical protein
MTFSISKLLRSPLAWLVFLLIAYSAYETFSAPSLQPVVRSDGRGYYAYLPAMVIYGDNSYAKVLETEDRYHEYEYDQQYLYKTADGKVVNKYFPGTALLQLPFFLVGCFFAWLLGQPVDGYSDPFMVMTFVGNTFYAVCAIILIARLYRRQFGQKIKRPALIVALLLLAGPVAYYGFLSQFYSQHISLFLFALAANLFCYFTKSRSSRKLIWLGAVLGLIFLVRPTNLVFVLFLPMLLDDRRQLLAVLQDLKSGFRKALLPALAAFFLIASLLPGAWKWQTGHWVVWSYSGEGFSFLHPELWAVLFSFRIGIFLQVPAFLLIIVAAVLLVRKRFYKLSWWAIYFACTVWIMAAWWCWDFESQFSVRPMTEHFLFLAFPLLFLAERRPKAVIPILGGLALLGVIRLAEVESGFMGDQRFTASNYIPSLAFWKKENHGRWNFTLSCKPFGQVGERKLVVESEAETNIGPADEFSLSGSVPVAASDRHGRMYYVVELEKRWLEREKTSDVFLVIDAISANGGKRYYRAVDLFADAYEGRSAWAKLRFEGLIPDYFGEYEKVTIYVWNSGKKRLKIRNYRAVVETWAAN